MHTPALSRRQILLRVLIVSFCLWHMFAVFMFSIPRAANDSFAVGTRRLFLPVVTPYVQSLSQWQLWDVFAPDPLRVISIYQIEKQDGNTWTAVETIKPGTYPFWQNATHYKYLINIISSTADNTKSARERFVQIECGKLHIPDGTSVRLSVVTTSLPWLTEPVTFSWWKTWTPEWSHSASLETVCAPIPQS